MCFLTLYFSPHRSPGSFSASSSRPTLSSTRRKCLPCFKVGVFITDGPDGIGIYSVSLHFISCTLIFFPSLSILLVDCQMINMQPDFKVSTQRFFADYLLLPPTYRPSVQNQCSFLPLCVQHGTSASLRYLVFWGWKAQNENKSDLEDSKVSK